MAIGHGQMAEGELERVMLDFVDHKFDLLLATTIVESGLDIPNANTIFIDEADRYGLADLHQLRGRVGRYKHRAYCYLLVDPNRHLSSTAARRLKAIEEFSQMGAGFAIAMRDLELRGAGNILGTQQSGHIATVGYELYCELLEQAVRQLKKLPPKVSVDVSIDLPVQAYIPPQLRARHAFEDRPVSASGAGGNVGGVRRAGGRVGRSVRPLARVGRATDEAGTLADRAHQWQIGSIHLEDGFAVFGYTNRPKIEQLAARSGKRLRVVDGESAYLPLAVEATDGEAVLGVLQSLLQPT